MVDIDSFIENYYSGDITRKQNMRIKRMCQTVIDYVGGDFTRADNLTKDDFLLIFIASGNSKLNRSEFSLSKTTLRYFFSWLLENRIVSKNKIFEIEKINYESVLKGIDFKLFFRKDLRSILNDIDRVGKKHFVTSDIFYGSEFLQLQSAVILIWYGMNIKDLVKITMDDIDIANGTVTNPATNETIKIDMEYFNYIYRLSDSKIGYDFKSKEIKKLRDGNRLFRGIRTYRISVSSVTKLFSDFNTNGEFILATEKIKNNAKFVAMHNSYTNNILNGMSRKEAYKIATEDACVGASSAARRSFIKKYNVWCSEFYE